MTIEEIHLRGKPLSELSRPELVAAFPQIIQLFGSENDDIRNTAFQLIKQLYQNVDAGILQNALAEVRSFVDKPNDQINCESDEVLSFYHLVIDMFERQLEISG